MTIGELCMVDGFTLHIIEGGWYIYGWVHAWATSVLTIEVYVQYGGSRDLR